MEAFGAKEASSDKRAVQVPAACDLRKNVDHYGGKHQDLQYLEYLLQCREPD